MAFALLTIGSADPLVVGAAFCLGFGLGAEYAIVAYLVSRAFGLRAYGAIYGIITLATSFGMAVGPVSIGISLVNGVVPTIFFTVAVTLLVLTIALLLTLRQRDLAFTSPARARIPQT